MQEYAREIESRWEENNPKEQWKPEGARNAELHFCLPIKIIGICPKHPDGEEPIRGILEWETEGSSY